MGERGPAPTPSAIKRARGTFRADRVAADEPKAAGKPVCPRWLPAEAQREFRRIAKELSALGVLGRIDGTALARYCHTLVRWRAAVAMVDKLGEMQVFKDEAGKVKSVQLSPYTTLARSLAEELGRAESAFGMNPSARTRISAISAESSLELPPQ